MGVSPFQIKRKAGCRSVAAPCRFQALRALGFGVILCALVRIALGGLAALDAVSGRAACGNQENADGDGDVRHVNAGLSVGEDGATHQCNEDIALMRTIPGMVVINPADDVEAKAAVEAAILYEGPVYLRFGRLATPVFNDPETYKFELGKGVKLRDGKDIAIVATGLMVYEAIEAAKTLAAEGIEATVINIHTIKPIDEDIIVEAAKNTGLLLTVEEHSVIGGLGSAVADVLAARHPAKLVKIGVNDEFGHSGPAVDLLKEYGLCADNIVAKARDAVKAK